MPVRPELAVRKNVTDLAFHGGPVGIFHKERNHHFVRVIFVYLVRLAFFVEKEQYSLGAELCSGPYANVDMQVQVSHSRRL